MGTASTTHKINPAHLCPYVSAFSPAGTTIDSSIFTNYLTLRCQTVCQNNDSLDSAVADLWSEDHPIWFKTCRETPTPRWHGTATDVRALIRTHVLRLVKGWKNETAVVTYLNERLGLAEAYGYDSIHDVSQSKLWRAWNKRYSDELKHAIEKTAQILVDTAREEDDESAVDVVEGQRYVVFETNHPRVDVDHDTDAVEKAHMVERMVRRYRHRWGIENGFKKIKTFMVRTSSKNHQYRFFNFAFACVLYNVWRLVDLLVKLAIDGENSSYTPKVDANRFLTHAKKYYGLDPPD